MTYDVVFSLEAAAELVRIAGAMRPALPVMQVEITDFRIL